MLILFASSQLKSMVILNTMLIYINVIKNSKFIKIFIASQIYKGPSLKNFNYVLYSMNNLSLANNLEFTLDN